MDFELLNLLVQIGDDKGLILQLLADILILFNKVVFLLLNPIDLLLCLYLLSGLRLHNRSLAIDSPFELLNLDNELSPLPF